jgi:hypothetical protein
MIKTKPMDIVNLNHENNKIEVLNTNNICFDTNKSCEIEAADRDVLLKLYAALEYF